MTGRAHSLSRRRALGLGLGLSASAVLGLRVDLARASRDAPRKRRASPDAARKRLLCIQLEGGADGLSLLPPLRDPELVRLRSRTRVSAPIALDSQVGLHPALSELARAYARGELLALTGVGLLAAATPHTHISAQQALERSVLQCLEPADTLAPRVLPVPSVHQAREPHARDFSAAVPLDQLLSRVARELAGDQGAGVVLVRVPGFDTHFAQAPRLAHAFEQLDAALGRFVAQLGAGYDDTLVLIASERGRSLRENRMGGTEDGAAGAALLLGADVLGGRVLSPWPSLAEHATSNRLPVTLELPRLLSELAAGLWRLPGRHTEHARTLGLLRGGGDAR